MSAQIPAVVASYMADIAAVLEQHATLGADHGTFSIGEVKIFFDGQYEGYSLVPNEVDESSFDIQINAPGGIA